jgi:hypothetical protein
MTFITRLFFIIFAFLLISSSSAEAGRVIKVFKCFGERVENGDTTYSVFKKCGEPAYKEVLTNEGCDKKEKWHYDCKGRGNVEELYFTKGILVDRIRGEKSSGTQTCK